MSVQLQTRNRPFDGVQGFLKIPLNGFRVNTGCRCGNWGQKVRLDQEVGQDVGLNERRGVHEENGVCVGGGGTSTKSPSFQ